jgi:hypothetical protein
MNEMHRAKNKELHAVEEGEESCSVQPHGSLVGYSVS